MLAAKPRIRLRPSRRVLAHSQGVVDQARFHGPQGFVIGVCPRCWRRSKEAIEKVGRGEWIRTTDLLVPNQTALPNAMIIEEILSC